MTLLNWNLDHPSCRSRRFDAIREFVLEYNADLILFTEANAAFTFPGYTAVFSQESPFIRRGRNMDPPNRYHQAAIYAKATLRQLPEVIDVNAVAAEVGGEEPFGVYAGVMTIKDRWAAWSDKTYSDRVTEQCGIIRQLAGPYFIAAGDFNFRGNRSYNKVGARGVSDLVTQTGLRWPSRNEGRTVQHLLHGPGLEVTYDVRDAGKLSDHPAVIATVKRKA